MRETAPASGGTGFRIALLTVCAGVLIAIAFAAVGVGPWVGRTPGTRTMPVPTLDLTDSPELPDLPDLPRVDVSPVSAGWLIWVLIAMGVVLVAALAVMVVFWLRGRRSGRHLDDEPEDEMRVPTPPPAHLPFDARAAADHVIACWQWVEAGARSAGLPRGPEQTPTEFLDRLGAAASVPRSAADELLWLYHRARFDIGQLDPSSADRAHLTAGQIRAAVGLLVRPEGAR